VCRCACLCTVALCVKLSQQILNIVAHPCVIVCASLVREARTAYRTSGQSHPNHTKSVRMQTYTHYTHAHRMCARSNSSPIPSSNEVAWVLLIFLRGCSGVSEGLSAPRYKVPAPLSLGRVVVEVTCMFSGIELLLLADPLSPRFQGRNGEASMPSRSDSSWS